MKLAVLGFSSAGRRHAEYLRELGHEVAVFDPALDAAPPGMTLARREEAAIDGADAVVVASPNALHARQTSLALSHDCHVLVEKPFAVSAAEGAEVAELAEQTDLVCAVAMNMRFHRAILELRRIIEENELGDLLFVSASLGYDLKRWRPTKDYRETYSGSAELGGGIVLDGIHELDYLVWLLGPARTVSAEVERVSELEIDVEDVALANIRFRSGVLGSVDLNFLDAAYRRTCMLVGDGATAGWDWTSGTITLRRSGHHDEQAPAETRDVSFQVEVSYRAEVDDFLGAIEGGSSPRAPARDVLESLKLADAMKRSSAEGRRIEIA